MWCRQFPWPDPRSQSQHEAAADEPRSEVIGLPPGCACFALSARPRYLTRFRPSDPSDLTRIDPYSAGTIEALRVAAGSRWLSSIAVTSKLDRKQRHQATREPCLLSSVWLLVSGEAGNCSTVACCPSHSRVSSTICPPGNSSAS